MKPMIHSQNVPLDKLETQMDHLENLINEQILKFSSILDISNQFDGNQESWCREDVDEDWILNINLNLTNPKL